MPHPEHPVSVSQSHPELRLLHPPLGGSFPPERAADPTFDLVVEELGKARKSVEIFMYVWRADQTGHRVGEAVLAAAERGVKIRIIKDIGASCARRSR